LEIFVLPVTDTDLLDGVRLQRVRDKLFLQRGAPEGTRVAVRLNLNYRIKKHGRSYAIQTIHAKPSPRSRALGYDAAVTVREATFVVDQHARASIASGRAHKMPMAAVVGDLVHAYGLLEGVELRFNPKTSHLFVRVDDHRAVQAAEEVTIFDTRAYARGEITYWNAETAPEALEGIASDARYE
jgi:hypothetical protein